MEILTELGKMNAMELSNGFVGAVTSWMGDDAIVAISSSPEKLAVEFIVSDDDNTVNFWVAGLTDNCVRSFILEIADRFGIVDVCVDETGVDVDAWWAYIRPLVLETLK